MCSASFLGMCHGLLANPWLSWFSSLWCEALLFVVAFGRSICNPKSAIRNAFA
jgi:hypothetical protein